MLAEYMDKAMRHAQFKRLEDGTIFGSIPGFQGVWADAPTEDECRIELREVLEGRILLGVASHDELPAVDGTRLDVGRTIAPCEALSNPA